jgi:hypothetical protein
MNMISIINEENSIEGGLHCDAMGGADDEAEVAPWKRLPDESSKAYHAFCLYLWDGHWRSMSKVADALGKGFSYENQLWKWSAKFNWLDRAQAFDTYVDTMQMRQYLAEQQATFGRHIEHASQLGEKVFSELMSRDLKELKPSELIRLYDIASKIERDTRALKSEDGNRISNPYAHSRLHSPLEVIKQVRQERKDAGIPEKEIAGEQVLQMLRRL